MHFTSFNFDACLAIKKVAPEAMVGFLTRDSDDLTLKRVADAKLTQICMHVESCAPDRVAAAKDRGLAVRAWGVADRELLRDALKAGIDGVTCNWPDWSLAPTR